MHSCYNTARMLDGLTVEFFEPLVGTSFFAVFPNGAKVELRLVSAAKVMESEAARLPRHPFSLFFHGPASYQLKQNTYLLEHEAFGEALPMFVVPVGQEPGVYLYEAVFA